MDVEPSLLKTGENADQQDLGAPRLGHGRHHENGERRFRHPRLPRDTPPAAWPRERDLAASSSYIASYRAATFSTE